MRAIALRAALAGTLLMGLLIAAGHELVAAALPLLRASFEWVGSDFRVLSFALDSGAGIGTSTSTGTPTSGAGERMLRAVVTLRHHVVLDGRVLAPDPRGVAEASTLALQGLHGPFVALCIGAAWPVLRGWPEAALRAGLLLPAAALLALLDAPVVLAASIWELIVNHMAPGSGSPLLLARDLLRSGGRLGAGVLIGVAAVLLAQRVVTRARKR
jgi:hypothetical protein